MARPPERITIKRRRDEEPVETLCMYPLISPFVERDLISRTADIEQKRIRSGYSWSRIDSHKPLIGGDTSLLTPSSILRQSNGIPIVRSTFLTEETSTNSFSNHLSTSSHLKEADYVSGHKQKETPHAPGVASNLSTPSKASQLNHKKSSPSNSKPQPRQFHLSGRTSSVFPANSEPNGRILKRKQRRTDLPVFVEKSRLARSARDTLPKFIEVSRDTSHTKGSENHDAGSTDCPRIVLGARQSKVKSCGADATRSTRILAKKSNEEYSQNSIMLAWQLQELATKESLRPNLDLPPPPQLQHKIKPKPPRPRRKEIDVKSVDSGGDQIMADVIEIESEEDFVYDTYVLSSGQVVIKPKDTVEPMISKAGYVDNNRIGILVIEDADQEIWETFAEGEESDKEWNSDEEDENGMLGHAVRFAETRLLMTSSRGFLWQRLSRGRN